MKCNSEVILVLWVVIELAKILVTSIEHLGRLIALRVDFEIAQILRRSIEHDSTYNSECRFCVL